MARGSEIRFLDVAYMSDDTLMILELFSHSQHETWINVYYISMTLYNPVYRSAWKVYQYVVNIHSLLVFIDYSIVAYVSRKERPAWAHQIIWNMTSGE